jgi:hypothetical protein
VLNCTHKREKKRKTRHRSALISANRLKLALQCGLSVKKWSMEKTTYTDAIGLHLVEPQQVMALLRLHGVPWDTMLCSNAALHSKLPLLQWLRRSSCPWNEVDVLCNASRDGSVPVLEWLLTVTGKWTDSVKVEMLNHAAWCNKLDAVKWLRVRGADWPNKFTEQYTSAVTNTTVTVCWSLAAVQWAISSGSGWLDWHCNDYAGVKYDYKSEKQQAAAVLQWAHANGCPCTCSQK